MQENRKQNVVATVGLAGALIGAGLTAAAMALTDKKNRQKVYHTIRNFRKQAADMLTTFDERVENTLNKPVEKKLKEDVEEAKDKADEKIYKTL